MTDRRFGTGHKFGTSETFGVSTNDALLAWGVEVDWDGDGLFDGANEARYMTSISVTRGRVRQLQTAGSGFERVPPGKLTIELTNTDGRYDGWNEDSPLYPNVTYGRDIRVKVRDWGTGTVQPVFYGIITDIAPVGYGGNAKVIITADDAFVYLRNHTSYVAMQEDVSPDEALGLVLDSVSWPDRWGRDLDASADSIDYWWTSGGRSSAAEIEDIYESFLGNFFIDAQGRAAYRIRSDTSDSVADFLQEYTLKDIANPQPWVNSRNIIKAKMHPRTISGTVALYQLIGTQPSIPDGESLAIWGTYTYDTKPVPAYSVITPVATTDYTMNTAADGSGTDKTADCTVTATNFGDTVKFVIANNSGGIVYVTKLQIRGVALYEQDATTLITPSDQSSITMPRELNLDLKWMQSINTTTDIVNILETFFTELHPYPSIQIEGRYEYQFGIELFDFVTLELSKLGISGDSYKVGGIEHKSYGENCQRMITKFHLESYPFTVFGNAWIWDTASVFGTNVFGV